MRQSRTASPSACWWWRPLLAAALLLPCNGSIAAQALKLLVPHQGESPPVQRRYFLDLLKLVMHKTEASDGPFIIEQYPYFISSERGLEELKQGQSLNVVWTVSNVKRERELLPVRISLLRELNNYRVFLIRTEDQARFDKVKTLDDLRQFVAGQGAHWPDTEILRSNNMPVTTSLNPQALFSMLRLKRFDYFPRGLYEVWSEIEQYHDEHISIEKNLMLHYPSPFYFFVNKNNPALADRIERGLKRAVADGSFEHLLLSVPGFKRGLEEQEYSKRLLFVLDSPLRPRKAAGKNTLPAAAR